MSADRKSPSSPRFVRVWVGILPLGLLLLAQKAGERLDGAAGWAFDRLEAWMDA